MKQVIRLASVLCALALCAASASSLNDGAYPRTAPYRDTDLGGGEYMVVVSGYSKVRAREIAFGRAREVCGSGGFDIIDGDVNKDESYTTTTHGTDARTTTTVEDTSSYDVTVIYQCRAGRGHLMQQQYAGGTTTNAPGNSPADLPRY